MMQYICENATLGGSDDLCARDILPSASTHLRRLLLLTLSRLWQQLARRDDQRHHRSGGRSKDVSQCLVYSPHDRILTRLYCFHPIRPFYSLKHHSVNPRQTGLFFFSIDVLRTSLATVMPDRTRSDQRTTQHSPSRRTVAASSLHVQIDT